MTETVAAMAEVVRVGGWALRALGYPFGVAERGIRLLAWSEAVHGQALRAIRLAEDRIVASAARPAGARVRDGETGWRIDGAGKHLLEIGAPAVDLLTADAARHGRGHVVLTDVAGLVVLAALVDLAARRGLSCVAVYRSGADDVLPDGLARDGWIAAVPGPGGSADFFVGEGEGGPGEGSTLRPGHVALSAARPEVGTGGMPAGGAAVDYRGRLADGYRLGLPMDAADLEHLYAVERRTWAPTSERSRQQAGYGVY